jgi:hypothetical protein
MVSPAGIESYRMVRKWCAAEKEGFSLGLTLVYAIVDR